MSSEGKIHALQIATESSIRSMQEQSKKLVTGKLKEVACQKIDEQTEALVSMIGDNQVDYRFFLGFKPGALHAVVLLCPVTLPSMCRGVMSLFFAKAGRTATI